MHVLLVTHYFPPGREVGSVRPARLAEALVRAGHEVTVVTAALHGEAAGIRVDDGALRVEVVESPVPVRLLLARLKFWRSPVGKGGAPSSGPEVPAAGRERLRARARRWILSALWTPDDRHRFIGRAVRAASRVHAARPVDLVYTTAPPFSVHLAGWRIARALRLPWWVEFRDPWTDVPRDQGRRSAASDWVEARMERAVLRRASGVVAVTPTVAAWLEAKRRGLGHADPVVVSFNGIPPFEAPPSAPGQAIEIVHAGTLYLKRNPRPVLAAIAAGIRRDAFEGRQVRLAFLGSHGEAYEGMTVTAMAEELGLAGVVRFEGHLPAEACRERMARATALLLLAQDQPAQIPNKLYDYLAARRPVLAVADPEGDSAALLRRVGGHLLVGPGAPNFEAELVEAVRKAAGTPPGQWRDCAVHQELSIEAQFDLVVRRLEATVVEGTPR